MRTGRVVFVTGAAGGMGSEFVASFLANDDSVVATDLKEDGLEQLASKQDAGGRLVTAVADVSAEHECQRIVDAARQLAGRMDVLVHAPGYFPMQPFEEMSSDDGRRVIDVNLQPIEQTTTSRHAGAPKGTVP